MRTITAVLLMCFFAIQGMCQDADKFIGKFWALEKYIVVEGGAAGYHDSIMRYFEITALTGNLINLKYFCGLDSVKATVKSDSFFIYFQVFPLENPTASIQGKGRLTNDSIYYQYTTSSREGVVEYDCIGSRYTGTFVNDLIKENNFLKCYPNPFQKNTYVKINIPDNIASAYIRIYSLNGILLKCIPLNQRGEFVQVIDGESFNAGVYYCALVLNNQVKTIFKLIKR